MFLLPTALLNLSAQGEKSIIDEEGKAETLPA